MTRAEQIQEAGQQACHEYFSSPEDKASYFAEKYRIGFRDGCNWADSFPQWKPCMAEIELDDYIHDHKIMRKFLEKLINRPDMIYRLEKGKIVTLSGMAVEALSKLKLK